MGLLVEVLERDIMANTFTQQAEEAGILQEGRFGGGINRDKVVDFLNQVDRVYIQEISKRDKELANLDKEIGERDDANAKANSVIQELKASSQEKDNQIASLQERVSAYEEGQVVAEGITTSLNEASGTIQALRDENNALKERLNHIENTDPAAETVAQRKTIAMLRKALAEAEESSDEALKAKIVELEQTVQAQKDAAEGGSPWSSLGDAASAVETLAISRANDRDKKSRTRAKAIVSQAQFTALEVIGKASKQYDSMMKEGESQVDVTNNTLHDGYTEYIKYVAGLDEVVGNSIQSLEDILDTASRKIAEVMSVVKSLREAQKPLVKAEEDVFKPVALSGIKTADKLPGMGDVLAFIASAPGTGISESNLTEKDVKDVISKVDAKYDEMQINIANTLLKDGEGETEEEETDAKVEATEDTNGKVADVKDEVASDTLQDEVSDAKDESTEDTTQEKESDAEPEDAPQEEASNAKPEEAEVTEDTPQEEADTKAEDAEDPTQPEVEEPEEVEPSVPSDETTVIPVVSEQKD